MSNRFLGLSLIFVGVLFFLDRIFIDSAPLFITWWPLLICFFGVAQLRHKSEFSGFIVLAIGLILLLRNIDVLPPNIVAFWPLVLIAIGVYIVFNKQNGPAHTQPNPSSETTVSSHENIDGTFRHVVVLSGINHTARVQTLRYGELIAVIGGITLDLHDVHLSEQGATIDAQVVAGGIQLRLPEDWHVDASPTVLFGGIDDKRRRPPSDSTKLLTIKGTILMGGIEIKS